jgi:hypothetical protein
MSVAKASAGCWPGAAVRAAVRAPHWTSNYCFGSCFGWQVSTHGVEGAGVTSLKVIGIVVSMIVGAGCRPGAAVFPSHRARGERVYAWAVNVKQSYPQGCKVYSGLT